MRTSDTAGLALMLATGCAASLAKPPFEPGKVWRGDEGLAVQILPLASADGGEPTRALVLVSGSHSVLDGKVLPHEVEQHGLEVWYRTTLRGRPFNTVVKRFEGSPPSITVLIPGRYSTVRLFYDDVGTPKLDPATLFQLHQRQQADGTLAELARFDRTAEEAKEDEKLGEAAAATSRACGYPLAAKIDWATVTDESLKGLSVARDCELGPLSAMIDLCKSGAARALFAEKIKRLVCRRSSGGPGVVEFEPAGALSWRVSAESSGSEALVTEALLRLNPNLPEQMRIEKTRLCTDGKAHFLLVGPNAKGTQTLSYGDGKAFSEVPLEPLLGGAFFEPRFWDKAGSARFNGLDARLYARVNLDEEKKTCAVRCGEKESSFTMVPPGEAGPQIKAAVIGPSLRTREPYQLLRDQRGTYYFIDRGTQPEQAKSFRLFRGPKGALKLQTMTNIVSDSQGEIFSTRSGELRLIIDKSGPSVWLEKTQKLDLKLVPVEDNYLLIYNELGVYTSERFGNPCDDV